MVRDKTDGSDYLVLAVVVDRDRGGQVVDCLAEQGVFSGFAMLGRGTASSEILGYLGLGETKKDVLIATLRTESGRAVLQRLIERCGIDKPGGGIAFTLSPGSVLYARGLFASEGAVVEGMGEEMDERESASGYDLILAVTNNGFSEMIMKAARSVRPSGGTIIRGRETGLKGDEKFFGVAIQPEKELVMILTPRSASTAIMQAIQSTAGPETKAGTFAVSLPAKDVAGLAPELREEK